MTDLDRVFGKIQDAVTDLAGFLHARLPERPAPEGEPRSTIALLRDAEIAHSASHMEKSREIARLRGEVERLTRERDSLREDLQQALEQRDRARAVDGEATSLLRELDAVKEERDEARQTVLDEQMRVEAIQGILETQCKDLAAAESRERKLREALERFGDHLPGCAHFHDLHDHIYPLPECSCGFHAALAAPPEEVRL